MMVLGARPVGGKVRLVGRPPNDYAQELQDQLDRFNDLASTVNVLLAALDINAGGGTVTIDGLGSDGADVLMLMGA